MSINVGHFLTRRAFLQPDTEGLVEPLSGRRFTFAELDARTNRTADMLRSRGIGRGDRVGLLMMNGVEFEEGFFAIAKLGAVVVPLNWRLVAEELSFIVKDADVRVLLYDHEFRDLVGQLQGLGAEGTAIEKWVEVGPDEGRPAFAESYAAATRAASPAPIEVATAADDLLFIMYTSGTTGLPKGVMHTHSTSLWAMLTLSATVDVRKGDRYLVALPLFHVGALTPAISMVYEGVTQVVMRQFDPTETWKILERERISNGLLVPAMLKFMLATYPADASGACTVDLGHLRWIMSGASPVPKSLIEEYAQRDIEIQQVYGLTETCGPACVISSRDALERAGSTGQAFFFTDVKISDEEGNELPRGEMGEVWIRGPHIMTGYLNRPDATAETIVDGWLRSGDMASMDDDGFVTIQDRLKDMIISGGENVYPAEIENVILTHEHVSDVAVIGIPSPRWGESPLAVVVRSSEDLTPQQVLDHCDGHLARYKLPKVAVFVDEIPRNPSGKALKRVLRDQLADVEAPD